MKKFLCLLCAVCIAALCCALLVACSPNKMKAAIKNGDEYTITAAYDDEAHVVSALQRVKLTNRSENCFDAVKLHLYANQYRSDAASPVVPNTYRAKAYPHGESWGDITFDSVKVNGAAVAYTVEGADCDILSVPIEGGLFPDKEAELELTYQVQLANTHHRLGYNDNTVNLGNWYPILCHVDNDCYTQSPYYNVGDPFVSEVANYNVSITLPEGYIAASTGSLQEATSGNGCVTYSYRAEAVRDFALVASKSFKRLCRTVGNTQVSYYYYNDPDAEASLDVACGMLEYLNKNVGEYPYTQYSVAETEFCYGGMEYPNLAMIASGSTGYREAVAHETAHQWFYGTVGNDQIANAWMDEGLSEYLTYLYLDSTGEMPLSRNVLGCTQTYVTYVDVLDKYYENADRTMRSVEEYRSDGEYVVFTYVKGSLMFNSVYEAFGAKRFWRALGDYYEEAQFTVAPPAQLIGCFANACGNEAASIFASFLEGKEIIGKVTD